MRKFKVLMIRQMTKYWSGRSKNPRWLSTSGQ